MPIYVTLLQFTEKGILHVKDTVKRSEAYRKRAKKHGATVKEIIWTQLGPDDLLDGRAVLLGSLPVGLRPFDRVLDVENPFLGELEKRDVDRHGVSFRWHPILTRSNLLRMTPRA